MLPVEPFRRLVERFIEQNSRSTEGDLDDAAMYNPINQLADATGITTRSITRIRRESQWIEFDTADKIVCAVAGGQLWQQDPELRELYYAADLVSLDQAKPTMTRRHGGGLKAQWSTSTADALKRRGASNREIAEYIGVPLHAIEGYFSRHGKTKPRKWDYAEGLRLFDEEGWTAKQIAAKFGIHERTVYTTLWRIKNGRQHLDRADTHGRGRSREAVAA